MCKHRAVLGLNHRDDDDA